MSTKSLLLALPLLTLCPSPAAFAQDDLESRELHRIVEEQEQLLRQLQRLRGTMEVLLQRLEAEGRPRTAELLRDAITTLDRRAPRAEGDRPFTVEERMETTRDTLKDGQLVSSLENQQSLIDDLERLLSILLDRKNLEALEEKIAELQELQEAIDALADREGDLRKETAELREQSSNAAQKELESKLGEMIDKERELLSENERRGRESGTLELEQLERELTRLLIDQRTDTEVLGVWEPAGEAELGIASNQLLEAQLAEAQAERMESAASALEEAARDAREATDPAELTPDGLREALRQAELAEKTSEDDAAARTAEALRQAVQALEDAQAGDAQAAEAARALEESSSALDQAAENARRAAEEARAQATETLEAMAAEDTTTGQVAEEVQERVERAREAAEEGDHARAKAATDDAVLELERARKDLAMLGEALSSSQADQAERAERLERGLRTMPQAETPSGQEASENLKTAAESMKDASDAARRGEAREAEESASRAQEALERALDALEGSRSEATAQQAEASQAMAAAQAELREQAEALDALVPEGSMNPSAQSEVQKALEKAREAMERAEQELSEGRSASAAGSQREAVQEMRRAQDAASEGVTPQSEADQERAAELAREQEQIREELLDLAKRIQERENARPMPNLDRADQAAQQAKEQLERGELAEAEDKEREVEQELKQIQKDLEEEEEQYQELREEEQLFRIAEEVQALIEGNQAQMLEVIEIDSQRAPDGPPSRAQRLRLRRVSREEEALAGRSREIAAAVVQEGAFVSAAMLENVGDDLERIAEALSERGDHETGDRTQALMRDTDQALAWILEALRDEQSKRQEEKQKKPGEESEQPEDEGQNQLVPDTAELKLLRKMEVDVQQSVALLLRLHPELSEDVEDVDERVLRDISRLALRHERVTELFTQMRQRLGIAAPEDVED